MFHTTRRPRSGRRSVLSAILAAVLSGALGAGELAAQDQKRPAAAVDEPVAGVPIDGQALTCRVDGNSVALSWNIAFLVPIRAFIVFRDGEPIAKLEPQSTRYLDPKVESGQHLYDLHAQPMEGESTSIGSCEAVVGDFRLHCRVDRTTVHLQWDILIDIAIEALLIRRDGVTVAKIEPNENRYADEDVRAGRHRYTLRIVPPGGSEFLYGACTVRVESAIVCRVDAPLVHIDWSRVPIPDLPWAAFAVYRDGAVVGRTLETNFTDRPGPGEHLYVVVAESRGRDADDVVLAAPDYLVGECKVALPNDDLPAPQELACIDLDAPEDVRDQLDEVELLGPHDVLLVWQKPVEYERVLIARNDDVIARIDGSQFWFIDRNVPVGRYVYSVIGIVGDRISAPAKCDVIVPRPPLEPPSDLTCRFIGAVDPVEGDFAPDGSVLLGWVNNARYDKTLIVHNGRKLAVLEGDATSFRHLTPTPGRNKYQVFGLLGIRQSEPAECHVDVPVGEVPPPRNLRCFVSLLLDEPLPAGDEVDEIPVPRPSPAIVHLRWENPTSAAGVVIYDKIIIARNKAIVATLPGDSVSFRDVPPGSGVIVYSVWGIVGDRRSVAASCEVDVPTREVAPPKHLECATGVIRSSDDPNHPTSLRTIVKLSWENCGRYRAIVIERNGEPLVKLEGRSDDLHRHRRRSTGRNPPLHGLRDRRRTQRKSARPLPCKCRPRPRSAG